MFPAFLVNNQAVRTTTTAEQRELDRNTGELAASVAGLGRAVARPFRARHRAPRAGQPDCRPAAPVAVACAAGCAGSLAATSAGRC
jgi:hypothetical protein